MELNYADMKLLIEAGYSGVLRNVETDVTPIFEAMDTWLPDNGAGLVGLALQEMVQGNYGAAEERLNDVIANKPQGKSEAKAIMSMCRALQEDMVAVEQIAAELEGEGSSAEALAQQVAGKTSLEDKKEQSGSGSQEPVRAASG